MTTGLGILEHVHALLSGCPELTAKVGDRMFPIATVRETEFPFIAYIRDSIAPEYCKDGLLSDTATCTVYIMSDSYAESVELAETARQALEGVPGQYGDTCVRGGEMTGAAEMFESDTFIQQMTFTFEVE